jgi:very-short-patch-repair endonuclease
MHPRQLPPISRSASFTTEAAKLAGVPSSRLRRSDLVAPFHGVRRAADDPPATLEERCRAYAKVMPAGMFFSHTTAAELYGVPVPPAQRGRIHVSAPRPRRAPRAEGVIGHRVTIAGWRPRLLRGLPVPEPAEVLCELAGVLGHDDLVRAGDALVRRTDPLTTVGELRAAVTRAHGRPGIATLRHAVPLIRARTDSPMETTLRLALVRAGLPEPAVNYRIELGSGGAAHLDLAYPHDGVAIEYDGDHHRTDERQYHIDGDRLWRIEAAGWRIVRLNRSHMAGNAAEAVARVRHALASVGRKVPPG